VGDTASRTRVDSGPPRRAPRAFALGLIQAYVFLLLLVPSNTVLAPVGAAGFPAALLGVLAFGLYGAWMLLGTHDPLRHRYPTRLAFLALWATSLVSYIVCQYSDRSIIESNGADRWLLFLAGLTGIALVAAEGLRSMDDIRRAIRAVVWAGAVCGVVAALQFWLAFDLAALVGQSIPGFTYNGSIGGIQGRGSLNRVPGTTLHPLELAAVTSLLLPLAVALAITDRGRSVVSRWTPVVLIGLCVPFSVSRSAILTVAVALAVLVVQLPARRRVAGLALVPFAVVAAFATIPGVIGTLGAYFRNAGSDTSISTRIDDYPLVESLVRQRPWFGQGGGTYLPDDLLTVLDNAYLKWVIEFGLVGLAVLLVFWVALPIMTALVARKRARTDETATLAAAMAAGLCAAAVAGVTFDSLAFPTFTCLLALVIGLLGALWQEIARQGRRTGPEPTLPSVAPRTGP
jgi:O-antigen ligase